MSSSDLPVFDTTARSASPLGFWLIAERLLPPNFAVSVGCRAPLLATYKSVSTTHATVDTLLTRGRDASHLETSLGLRNKGSQGRDSRPSSSPGWPAFVDGRRWAAACRGGLPSALVGPNRRMAALTGAGFAGHQGGRHGFSPHHQLGLLGKLACLPVCEKRRPFSEGYSQRACWPCESLCRAGKRSPCLRCPP